MFQVKKTFYVFTIALLLFLLIVPFVSYKTFKAAIKNEIFKHLITTRDLLNFQVENFFHERFGDVDVLARNPIIAQSFSQLINSVKNSGIDSNQYSTIARLYDPLLQHYVADYGYTNILFINKNGDVIYSVSASEFKGQNLKTGDYKDFSISLLFEKALVDVEFEDFTWNEEVKNFTCYFGSPVYEGEDLLGVITIEVPFSHLDHVLVHRAGLGQTGEMYLVGDDGFMRSNSRFSEESTILQMEVDTDATREAFSGNIGTKIGKDYRDVWVLSAYAPLNLKFVDWVLIVEIDKKEAFFSIRFVELWLIVVGSLIGGIAMAYIYLTERIEKQREQQMSKPVKSPKKHE